MARAALSVVARDGIEALTHRAVSCEADVPLGSTTYHFVDREDLLLAALEQAVTEERRTLEEWAAGLGPRPDLPGELTDLIVSSSSGAERQTSVVGYELYVAALRHPNLRRPSAEWTRLMPALLERFVDADTAEALAIGVEALVLRGLVGERQLERGFIESTLRRIARA